VAAKARAIVLASRWCKVCGICIEFCPRQVFEPDPLTGLVRVERPEACSGCRLCELLCPDYVISVEEQEDAVREPDSDA
jgi:2-oxoglutarate ferredoxin oxidoreductase subunit delta